MKKIKLFENFDDLPFSEDEIDEIFKSHFEDIPKIDFIIETGKSKRVDGAVLVGDELLFDINSVILVTVKPDIVNVLNRTQILKMNQIRDEYKYLFDGVVKTLESRGFEVDIIISNTKFLFYIYIK
jgi:hypothetical protein